MKNSFLIYHEYKEVLEDLTNEELGILFRAVFEYEIDHIEPSFTGLLKMAFRVIKGNLDRDRNKYDKRCETSARNGKLGGAPKGNKNAKKQPKNNLKQPKQADNDNETENDTDNVNDNDNENDKGKSADLSKTETNADLFSLIEESFGRTLNSIEYETIRSWEDNDLTRYAVKESILNGARGIRYIETVLSSWKAKGFKTVQDVQAYQKKRQESKQNMVKTKENVPDWFDKKIETEQITKEEQDEMDKLLEEFK